MKNEYFYDEIIDYGLLENIDKDILIEYSVLPVKQNPLHLSLLCCDPFLDTEPLVRIFSQPVKLVRVERRYLDFLFKNLDLSISLFTLAKKALGTMGDIDENIFIDRFLDKLFEFSIKNDVSDIHIETLEKTLIIRLRIDGVLNRFFKFSKELYPLLASVIKLYGNLDISQKRLPADSSFTKNIFEENYDFRISTLPSIYGESIVLRILDNKNVQKDIDKIGFDETILNELKSILSLNQGLILVTGPTGSGKTTTLYSMLNFLNNNQRKIISIEDPVEYKLAGVVQVNINYDIELDYQKVLKNILRQDPDILMIGEIRDCETLAIAMRAALTGHLVIATLHTNNAHETITRLFDLKAPAYLVSSTLKTVLSQRLLRVLCPHCKKEDNSGNCIAVGCKKCNLTGYKGRRVVSEIVLVDDHISKLINENKSIDTLMEYSLKNGFKSLEKSAKDLLISGETSYEEYFSKV